MLIDAIAVEALPGHRLRVKFEDGASGEVAITDLVPLRGVFTPLLDEDYFARGFIDHEAGVVCWPNGLDLDPVILYCRATGTPLPDYAQQGE